MAAEGHVVVDDPRQLPVELVGGVVERERGAVDCAGVGGGMEWLEGVGGVEWIVGVAGVG